MAEPDRKGSLPEGWIVQVSKKYPDRVYYFNVITGNTTWECPKLQPPGANMPPHTRKLSDLNRQAPTNRQYAVHPKVDSPAISLQDTRILELLSDAKKESQKISTKNETPSSPPVHSKLSTPPTAIVAPLDKNLVTSKKRKKKPKKKTPAESAVSGHSSGTPLQRNDSEKVSFSIKSKNKIPVTKSEKEILSKSKTFTPIYKKKQSLVISLPPAKKSNDAVLNREIRSVTLDKSKVLPSSDLNVKSKELLKKRQCIDQQISPAQFTNKKPSGPKDEKECKLSGQNQLSKSNKERCNVLNSNSGGDIPTSTSKSLHESDCELSDMDCEMNPDFEELTVTVSTAGANTGASTSRSYDMELFDIEMLDVSSSDLVEIDDKFLSGFEGNLLDNFFIVVDTNVFISELKDIDEMKDTPVNGCGPPHFIIPWVVFQELDNLKRNGSRPKPGATKESSQRKCFELKKSAGDAIRYLNTLLKAKHPRFHFQRPDEAQNCRKDFSRNNDDQLLECCMKLQEKMPKENVILLTNDTNLANKSMVLNIVVHNKNSLLEFLKPNTNCEEVVINTTYVPEPFKVLAEQKSLEQLHQANYKKCELEIHAHLSMARQILKDVLDPLFEREMDEAYGDAWHFFPVERHVLNGILKGILKYWRTVFTFFFKKEEMPKFETLLEKASRPEGFLGERAECLNIFKIIEELFVIIKRKWPTIHVPITQLQKVKTSTEEAFSNLSECEKSLNNVENAIKQAEISCCIEVFNHNWTIINHIVGCTADFCGIPHDFVYDKSAPVPQTEEFRRIVPQLHSSLGVLKDKMERMLLVVKSSTQNLAVFKELRKILAELVPDLKIQAESISLSNFSVKMVEKFCRLPENRKRIEEGYKQLLNFYESLGKSLHVLMTQIR